MDLFLDLQLKTARIDIDFFIEIQTVIGLRILYIRKRGIYERKKLYYD